MYRKLDTATLKNGAAMEIGVILAPDPDYNDQIRPFLSHKGDPYSHHLDLCVAGEMDDLETYFYVGITDGEIITNIMTVEHDGCGILGHVYTKPESRRLGACGAVMPLQMEDFRRRGGKALYLGTGFDSAPYHIYKRNGFLSVLPRVGMMSYFASDDFAETQFAPRPASARAMRWGDWGPLTTATGIVHGDWLRSVALRMFGPTNFEGGFISLKRRLDNNDGIDARILVADDGARVGFATLVPDPIWQPVHILDVFCHPNFWDQSAKLIDALHPGDKRLRIHADADSRAKIAAMTAAGFREVARLPKSVRRRLNPDWQRGEDTMFDDTAYRTDDLDLVILER
ncbi:MAG: hypothetical protein O3A46_03875 [Candidatus Poribacteria bacterium]|nr:hypothetical protein [Candidatus Poribacteria bacterium]